MDVVDEVRKVVANALRVPLADIKPDTRLDDVGLNSLDVIEVIYELEEKFGIDIPLEPGGSAPGERNGRGDSLPFETIGEVADAIRQHIGAKPAP